MSVFVSNLLVRRLIAKEAALDPDVVNKALDAADTVMLRLLESGASVRVLANAGYLAVKTSKVSRYRHPVTGKIRVAPEKSRIIFKASKITK